MPAAQYFHPYKMDTSLIETHYNHGRPMSDLALFNVKTTANTNTTTNIIKEALRAARSARPSGAPTRQTARRQKPKRTLRATDPGGRTDRHSVDVGPGTVASPERRNVSASDATDTRQRKRTKVVPSRESGTLEASTPATGPIAVSQSVEALLARQASKPKSMISRRTRPVRAGSDTTAHLVLQNKAKAVGGGAADAENAPKVMNKDGGAPLEVPVKETASRMRKAAEAPLKRPTTSFASPPKYRK